MYRFTIDLINFQNNEVQTMQSMFSMCENLVSINLNNLRTSSVTNMNSMFDQCWIFFLGVIYI